MYHRRLYMSDVQWEVQRRRKTTLQSITVCVRHPREDILLFFEEFIGRPRPKICSWFESLSLVPWSFPVLIDTPLRADKSIPFCCSLRCVIGRQGYSSSRRWSQHGNVAEMKAVWMDRLIGRTLLLVLLRFWGQGILIACLGMSQTLILGRLLTLACKSCLIS